MPMALALIVTLEKELPEVTEYTKAGDRQGAGPRGGSA